MGWFHQERYEIPYNLRKEVQSNVQFNLSSGYLKKSRKWRMVQWTLKWKLRKNENLMKVGTDQWMEKWTRNIILKIWWKSRTLRWESKIDPRAHRKKWPALGRKNPVFILVKNLRKRGKYQCMIHSRKPFSD